MTDRPTAFEMEWKSEAETARFGELLASYLKSGDMVALIGPLGAGKTKLVQAIACGLEIPPEVVNSPTFMLIQEYAGRLPVRHCDVYRLKSPLEFAELGIDDLFAGDGVAIVEWADRVAEFLPDDRLDIRLEPTGLMARRAQITGRGLRGRELVSRMRSAIASRCAPDRGE